MLSYIMCHKEDKPRFGCHLGLSVVQIADSLSLHDAIEIQIIKTREAGELETRI